MAISYTSTNANLRSGFANSLVLPTPYLRKAFYDEYRMLPTLYDKFLNVDNSKLQTERENVVGGRGIWTSKNEAAEYTFGDFAEGAAVLYTHVTYTDAFDVSEEMKEDNQWKTVMANAREMARGGYAAVETQAANVLNNGFAGGTTGSDGGQLFASDHNLINSASTGDNAETLALSAAGLDAMYILGDKIVNEANLLVPVDYDTLIVPPELRTVAEELVKSTYTPESGNNAVNVFKNRIKQIVVNPYLTSTTAWFLASSGLAKKGKLFWRVQPQFKPEKEDVFSGNSLYIARERFSVGHTEWQGILGSTGVA